MAEKLTCTIIAKNEVARIERTIRSVAGLADEVVVVDSGSTDGTQALATSLGARVVFNPWPGYGPQKRFAEDQASHDFILNLDADEWLSDPLFAELQALKALPNWPARSFWLKVMLVYQNRTKAAPFAYFNPCVRLYDRRATRFDASTVYDEVPATDDIRWLQAPVLHQSFTSMAQLMRKQLNYFEMQAKELKPKRARLWLRLPFEFPVQFFKYYILRRHIFGGIDGLVVSQIEAFMRFVRLVIFLGL